METLDWLYMWFSKASYVHCRVFRRFAKASETLSHVAGDFNFDVQQHAIREALLECCACPELDLTMIHEEKGMKDCCLKRDVYVLS